MQGFRSVADSGGTQTDVLQEAQDAHAVHGVHAVLGAQQGRAEFAEGLAVLTDDQVGLEVLFGGHGDHQAARDVFCQSCDLVGESGDVLLADVGFQQVDLVVAGLRLVAVCGAGDAAAVHGLVEVGHLDQLILDGGSLLSTVIFRGQSSSADDDVANADLAAAVTLSVIAGEAFDQHACKFGLAVHEDVFVGNEDVVQDNEGFLAAVFLIAQVDVRAVFQLAGIAGLSAVDHEEAVRIGGAGEAQGEILVFGLHGDGWHKDVPVGVDGAGLVGLGASYDDAVFPDFLDVHVDVGIGLLAGALGAVTLGVGHGTVHGEVVVLNHDEELLKAFVIVRTVLFVDLERRGIDGVERVHTHAALEAGSGLLAQHSLHLDLLAQVVGAHVDVGKAVDLVAGEVAGRDHQAVFAGFCGGIVGGCHAVDGRTDHGMIHPVLDPFAEHVDFGVQFTQRFDVLCSGH